MAPQEGVDPVKAKTYNCPVEAAVDVFGGKWKALILWWLQQRTWRFAELRRQIPGITEKMLTQQLRELEADGIVARRVYATVPPKVEYSLTEYGRSLKRALRALCDWGRNHMVRIGAIETPPVLAATTNADGQSR
jgi:DNA-binding HxlR family transcriptional regulator